MMNDSIIHSLYFHILSSLINNKVDSGVFGGDVLKTEYWEQLYLLLYFEINFIGLLEKKK